MADNQSKTPNRGSYGLGSEASFTGYSQFSGSQQPTNVSYNHYMQTAGGGTQQPMFVPIYIHSPNKGKEKTDRRHSRRDGHSKKRPRDEDDAKAPFRKEHQGEIILEEDLERDLKRRRAEAAANEVAIKQAVADQKAEIERLRDQVNKLSAQHRAEAAASAQKFKTLEDQCARYATQIEEMTKQSALVQSINTEMRTTRSTVDKLDARMAQMEKMPAPQPATAAPSMPKLDASKTPFGSSEPPTKPPTESTVDTTKAQSTELPKPATGAFSFGAAATETSKVETKATEEDTAKPPASTTAAGFSFGGTKAEDAPKVASPFGGSAPASASPAPKLDTTASFSFGSTPSLPGQSSSTATAAPAAPTPAPAASTPFGGSSPFSSTAPAATTPAAPTSSSPFGAAPTTAAPASAASPFGAPSAPTPSSGGNPFATAGAAPSFNTGGASAPAPSGGFGAAPSAPAAPNVLGARKTMVRAKRY